MALNLGDLYGTLSLDSKPWDTAVGDAKASLKGLGSKGKVLAGVAGAAIGAALAAGIVKSMDVEAANDKLAASLGLTKKQSERAGKAAGKLFSSGYGSTMGDVSGAVESVMGSVKGMRNASAPQIEAMTKNVLNMAEAFEVDAGQAAQVAGRMINTGLAKNGRNATDLLIASLQKVGPELRGDMLDAVDEYGPAFAQVGLSGEKAMGLLVAASKKGAYGIDKTGDAIKEFGAKAGNLDDTGAQEALEGLGLSGEDMASKITQGGATAGEAMDTIVKKLVGMDDPGKQAAASIALFGAPMEDLSGKDIPKLLKSLADTKSGLKGVKDASKDFDKELNSNAQQAIRNLGRTMKSKFVNVLGGAVIPAISKAAKWLNTNLGPAIKSVGRFITGTAMPALRKFADWFRDNRATVAIIAGVITAIFIPALIRLAVQSGVTAAATLVAFLKMQGGSIKAAAVFVAQSWLIVGSWVRMSAAAVTSGIKTAAVWTGTIIKQAVKGAVAFGVQAGRIVAGWVLMGVQSLLQAGRMAAAWFIALGPVGWVIGAVVGLVALIIANWDKISKWTGKAWKAVTGFVVDAWKNVKKWTISILLKLATWILNKYNDIKNFTGRIWNALQDIISDVWGNIEDGIHKVLLGIVRWVRGKFEGIVATGKRIWNNLLDIIEKVWGNVRDAIKGVWNKGIKPIFQALKDFITKTIPDAFERGVDGIRKIWDTLEKIAKAPIRFIVETVFNKGLRPAFNKVMDFVGSEKRLDPIALPKGFRKGGYTGTTGRDKAAGVVHGQEWVVPAEATAQIRRTHPGLLEGMTSQGSAALPPGYKEGGFVWPVPKGYPVTQNPSAAHPAYDIGTPTGTTVRAAQDGRVTRAGPGYRAPGVWGGNEVWLGHGGGVGSLYAHLSRFMVGMGDMVKQGQPIARSGNTGISSGPHLHFGGLMGGQMVSPSPWLNGRGIKGGIPEGDGGGFDPLGWVADKVTSAISSLLDKIPGAGMMLDLAMDVGKYLFKSAKDWAIDKITGAGGEDARDKSTTTGTNKFGNMAIPTLMDGGGWLRDTGGPQLVDHNRRKPDAFTPYDQWKQVIEHAGNSGMPDKFTLVIEGEEFPAYMRRTAVGATGNAMNTADSRMRSGGKYTGSFV